MGVDQLIKPGHAFRVFENREQWAAAATEWLASDLADVLEQKQKAIIALSGGSTPVPIYEQLSKAQLEWDKIQVEIVDDRVTQDPGGLNSVMIEKTLRKNSAVNYISQKLDETTTDWKARFDICVMGMGTDGHTASWFPGSEGLENAMSLNTSKVFECIHASGCPGAGKYPIRSTMTLPAILNSKKILLLMTGEEKRKVFENAANKSVYDAPVKALLAAGDRLTVMWAP